MDFTQIVPISDLPRKYDELLRRSEPVVLFRRNKPAGVLMGYNLWDEYLMLKRKYELADALVMVEEGEKAYKEGKTKILGKPSDLWKKWDEK